MGLALLFASVCLLLVKATRRYYKLYYLWRTTLDRAAPFAAGTSTVAILTGLSPNYAWALQVPEDDARIQTSRVEYASPQGHGTIKGYMVRPAGASGKLPGVVVVHENRGLNPYIEDVARRVGLAGHLALAPDGLTPKGG